MTDLMFYFFGFSAFDYVELTTGLLCLPQSEPVKQEVIHTYEIIEN